MGAALLLPGLVDAHMHYPQTGIVASWGRRLVDWLDHYTFPEEMRLADPAYAAAQATLTLDLALAHGTTTLASFCTIHAHSVDALFEAAAARGMASSRAAPAWTATRPTACATTRTTAHDESAALIARWHGRGPGPLRRSPPASPPPRRPSSSRPWAPSGPRNPTCLMQTHLSEQTDEVAWVADLHPQARDYLDTYERHGLIGPGALFGHAIHLTPRERARLAESGSAVIHCPTSNTFIGSGLFDCARSRADGIHVGLATDTGGGSSFSMLRTMGAAYEIGQLSGTALHPAQLLWLATEGIGPRAADGGRDRHPGAGQRRRPHRARPRLHPRHRPARAPARRRSGRRSSRP